MILKDDLTIKTILMIRSMVFEYFSTEEYRRSVMNTIEIFVINLNNKYKDKNFELKTRNGHIKRFKFSPQYGFHCTVQFDACGFGSTCYPNVVRQMVIL